jgi:hypothetical protein
LQVIDDAAYCRWLLNDVSDPLPDCARFARAPSPRAGGPIEQREVQQQLQCA